MYSRTYSLNSIGVVHLEPIMSNLFTQNFGGIHILS